MKKKFKCWEAYSEDEDAATEIDASSPLDAAEEACKIWYNRGRLEVDSGSGIEVRVRDANGALWLVDVNLVVEVSFYSSRSVEQVLANIEDLQNFQATDTVWGPKIRRYAFLTGAAWSAMTLDERRECKTLYDELKRVGFDPGWIQAE